MAVGRQPRPDLTPAARAAEHAPAPGSVILACEMIEDEIGLALERARAGAAGAQRLVAAGSDESPPRLGAAPPTLVWIESGLHERPERLRDHIQLLVDLLDEAAASGRPAQLPSVRPGSGPAAERAETVAVAPVARATPGPSYATGAPGAHTELGGNRDILLALGYCGNGLQGLVSVRHRLVFPRVDDCISLFLNHGCSREEIVRDAHAFYLTKGWLCHDNPVQESLDAWKERFGPERARALRKATMAAYERVTLIDTGAFDVASTLPDSHSFAADLELEHTQTAGSIALLERLFAGPWDSEIVVVPPGEAISIFHLFGPQ
ncbi:MAG: DUF1638 domain-containing protein [Thermoleophilia bacterium]